MPRYIDITNQRFGRLVAKEHFSKGEDDRRRGAGGWICKCDCGEITYVRSSHLRAGLTQSCGCQSARMTFGRRSKTHGQTNTRTYRAWCGMIRNHHKTGVAIEPAWQHYMSFQAAMGVCPADKTSLCRRDPQQGYNTANCWWGTKAHQAARTGRNRMITFQGHTRHLSEWARILKLSYSMLERRLRKQGLSIEEAFKRPHRLAKAEAQKWMRDNLCTS